MARGQKPVIGISVGLHDFGDYAGVGFQRPIALAGGVPLILSCLEDSIEDMLDVVDGVIQIGRASCRERV